MEMNINDMIGKIFKTQDGSSLRVISITGRDSVKALCTRCRQEDVYRASMLRNGNTKCCKKCEEIYKYKVEDTVGTFKIINRTVSIPHKYYALGIRALPINELSFGYKVQCTECGFKNNISAKNINKKCACQIKKEDTHFDMHGVSIQAQDFDRTGKKIIRRAYTKNLIDNSGIKQEDSGYDEFKGLINPKSVKEVYERATFPNLNLVGENWIIVTEFKVPSVTGSVLTEKVKIQCIKCGAVKEVSKSALNKLGTCDNCTKVEKDNNRMLLTNIDWIGKIKNNLKIIHVFEESNGVKYCNAECLLCHSIHKYALIVFLTQSRIVCSKCAKEQHEAICPACRKMHIRVSPFEMFVGKDKEAINFICEETGRDVPVEEVAMYQNALLEQDEYCKEYSGKLTLERDINMIEPFASMLKFKEHYIGTDGEKYNTYMCKKHHKMISLREDEAVQYQHEYCTDKRMMAIINKKKSKQ